MHAQTQALIARIDALPPERIDEVADFVEFLRLKEQNDTLTHAATHTSAPSFAQAWNNPEDDVYDAL